MSPQAPYTPGFGISPPVLVGRDDLLDGMLDVLRRGPGHPHFCCALLGHRGVGKTAVLDVLGRRVAAELGWPVLHRQAMREVDLLADLAGGLPQALSPWARAGREYGHFEKQLSLALNLGVLSARASLRSPGDRTDPGPVAFSQLLRHVGEFAHDHGSGLLVTVDEAMSARRTDLAGIAGAIQTTVNRSGLPVAVVLAGLPSLREAIAVAGTFAERLATRELNDLSLEQSRLALLGPAAGLQVRWNDAALELVTRQAGGHPYYLQLFGYHTWIAAGGASELSSAHARAGIAAGQADLAGQFEVTWNRVRPQERAMLMTLASRAGAGPMALPLVASSMGRRADQLDAARYRLIHYHGLLTSPRRGEVQFRSAHFAGWVRGNHPLG